MAISSPDSHDVLRTESAAAKIEPTTGTSLRGVVASGI